MNFIDAQNGFAVQQNLAVCGGRDCWLYGLVRTTDAGQTWITVLPTPSDLSGAWWSPRGQLAALGTPHFSSPTLGWIPFNDPALPGINGGVL